MVLYNDKQVKKLLEEILIKLPENDNSLIGIRKFIKNKIENINKHI